MSHSSAQKSSGIIHKLSIAFLMLASHLALAANIQVRATDDSNHPLSDVKVQVLLQGKIVRSAISNSQGQAEFPELPNGIYDISASKEGFEPALQKHVQVQNNSLESIEIVLSPKLVVKEEVSVDAGTVSPLESTASSATEISRLQIKEIPGKPATVKDALPLVPGVLKSADGQIQISGLSEHHSAFLVNSADVTDPVTGQFGLTLPVDSVESLKVLKNPFEAQYGGFTAGVVAIDTRRGGEKWNFEFNDPSPEFRIRSGHIIGLREFTPRLTASGPVIQNKLYLAEGFTYDIEKHAVRTLQFPFNESKLQSFNSFTQMDYLASSSHILTATFHVAPQQQKYANLDFFNPQPVTPDFESQSYNATLLDRISLQSGVLQSTLSTTKVQAEVDPQGNKFMVLTPLGNRGNYFSRQERSALRTEELENFSFSPLRRAGVHNFQIGTEVGFTGAKVSVLDHPIIIRDEYNRLLRRIDFSRKDPTEKQNLEYAVYAQDHWLAAARLAFDLGARVERDTLSGTMRVAPRFGFQAQPWKNLGTIVKGGFGVFYDRVPLNIGLFERWPEEFITTFTDEVTVLGDPQHYYNRIIPSRHKRFAVVRFGSDDSGFAPSSFAWNLQVEHKFAPWIEVRTGYSENNGDNLILLLPEAVATGNLLALRDLGKSRYRQLEFTTRTQWKKAQVSFSYVRSRAIGDLNEFDTFLGSFPVPTVPQNRFGTLPTDVPNRFLAFGQLSLPRKIVLSPLLEFRTGFPYQTRDVFQNFVATTQRYPDYFSLDARIARRFQVTKKYGVIMAISGTNLTNHFNALAVHANTADPQFGQFFGSYNRRARLDIDVDF